MAIRGATERRISDLWNRPIEWAHGLSLRVLEWFTQERWNLLLTILALVVANLIILQFFLQGQDNRAIAFVILALLVPLMWHFPELSIAVFIISGSRLLVNTMYFAIGPGGGTGERTVNTFFLIILTARALYEYLRLTRSERPKIFSWFSALLILFWFYYMMHVAYIYLFLYNVPPADSADVVLGTYRPGLFRFFDYHMLWIGVLPVAFLMRDLERVRRALLIVGVVVGLSVLALLIEYFAPLPTFWKVVFQIRAAGETQEGYRVRDPSVMYLMVAGLFTALYSLGHVRGWRNVLVVTYVAAATYGVLITKNRALWIAIMPLVPFALLWKPPAVLGRQLVVISVSALLFLAGMLHPVFYEAVSQKINETVERWQRSYAFGGDPRNDPSYQWRLREKEAWEIEIQKSNSFQILFGRGLEEPYGLYIPLTMKGYSDPRFSQLYVEKQGMHFSWLYRLLTIGWIGTTLFALLLIGALVRIGTAFVKIKSPFVRSLLMGVAGGTVAGIGYDTIHSSPLDGAPFFPIVLLWSVAELAFHWHRTGQLNDINE